MHFMRTRSNRNNKAEKQMFKNKIVIKIEK